MYATEGAFASLDCRAECVTGLYEETRVVFRQERYDLAVLHPLSMARLAVASFRHARRLSLPTFLSPGGVPAPFPPQPHTVYICLCSVPPTKDAGPQFEESRHSSCCRVITQFRSKYTNRYYVPQDLFLGANVPLATGHTLVVTEMDRSSLALCEEFPREFPLMDYERILGRVATRARQMSLDLRR